MSKLTTSEKKVLDEDENRLQDVFVLLNYVKASVNKETVYKRRKAEQSAFFNALTKAIKIASDLQNQMVEFKD